MVTDSFTTKSISDMFAVYTLKIPSAYFLMHNIATIASENSKRKSVKSKVSCKPKTEMLKILILSQFFTLPVLLSNLCMTIEVFNLLFILTTKYTCETVPNAIILCLPRNDISVAVQVL